MSFVYMALYLLIKRLGNGRIETRVNAGDDEDSSDYFCLYLHTGTICNFIFLRGHQYWLNWQIVAFVNMCLTSKAFFVSARKCNSMKLSLPDVT
jgi:hypothetical protein